MAKTILLADDSMTIQKVVELTFMDQDYQVVAVSDGDTALQRIADLDPDLVIADVHMPGANGYEVCRRTKAAKPGTPVLLLVGTFEQFDELAARSAGADGDLKKPFDSQELLGQVERLLAIAEASAPPKVPAPQEAPQGLPEPIFEQLEESADYGTDFELAPAEPPPAEPPRSSPAVEFATPDMSRTSFADPEPEPGNFYPGISSPSSFAPEMDSVSPLDADDEAISFEMPETRVPEPPAEESSEIFSLEAEAPEPELEALDFDTPDVDTPQLDTPEFDTPQLDTPQLEELELDTPQLEELELDTPELEEPPSAATRYFDAEPAAVEPASHEAAAPSLEASTSEPVETQYFATTPAVPAAPLPVAPLPDAAADEDVAEVEETSTAPARVDGNAETRPMAANRASSNGLSDEDVERIARRMVELIAETRIHEVAWEVIPDLAEVIIKERIRELESQVESA